jgi:hypothetical protein
MFMVPQPDTKTWYHKHLLFINETDDICRSFQKKIDRIHDELIYVYNMNSI